MASAGRASLTTLEDPLVDRLVWRALQRGCGAVIARTPRAAIDCNRAEDEVDPSVVDGGRRGRVTRAGPRRARHRPGAHAAARLSVAAADQPGPARRAARRRRTGPITEAIERTARRCCSTASAARFCSIATRCRRRRRALPPSSSATAAAAPPTRWVSDEAHRIARALRVRRRAQRSVRRRPRHRAPRAPGARRPRAADRDRPPLLSRSRRFERAGPGFDRRRRR